MHTNTITKLPALPKFQVVTVLEHAENSLHLYVDLVDTADPVCSVCGIPHHEPVHSLGWICVEDLAICGKRTFLYIPKRKSRCPLDGRIRVENFDELRGRFTPALCRSRLSSDLHYHQRNLQIELTKNRPSRSTAMDGSSRVCYPRTTPNKR